MEDVNQELDLIRYPSGRLRCGPYNEPEAGKVLEMIERRLLSVARKSLRGFPVVGLTGHGNRARRRWRVFSVARGPKRA
jgi:hypothetical protein